MKWLPFLSFVLFISCNDVVRSSRNSGMQNPLTQPLKQTYSDLEITSSRGITHLDPKIKIDKDRQEIEITGHSGKGCGIDFLEGQILRYQLLDESEMELVMETETLKFRRIHRNDLVGIYGDWQSIDFKEEENKSRERIVTLFIRDNEIMNADVYCEQRYGKLIEEF